MEEKNKNTWLIISLIFFIIVSIGLGGYICYDKFLTNEEKNKSVDINESQENESIINKNDVPTDSQIVSDAMESFNKLYISNDSFYKTDKYNISNISDYDLIASAIKNIDNEKIAYCISESNELKNNVSFDIINNELKNLLENKKITYNSIKSLKQESSYPLAQYEVNNFGIILNNEGIQIIGSCGDEFHMEDFINKKIIEAEKENNYLYIYEKQAFARYSGKEDKDGSMLVDYYKDYNKTVNVEKGLGSIEFGNPDGSTKKDSNPEWELYNTYKYTFKIIDNKYYFENFELVK